MTAPAAGRDAKTPDATACAGGFVEGASRLDLDAKTPNAVRPGTDRRHRPYPPVLPPVLAPVLAPVLTPVLAGPTTVPTHALRPPFLPPVRPVSPPQSAPERPQRHPVPTVPSTAVAVARAAARLAVDLAVDRTSTREIAAVDLAELPTAPLAVVRATTCPLAALEARR